QTHANVSAGDIPAPARSGEASRLPPLWRDRRGVARNIFVISAWGAFVIRATNSSLVARIRDGRVSLSSARSRICREHQRQRRPQQARGRFDEAHRVGAEAFVAEKRE